MQGGSGHEHIGRFGQERDGHIIALNVEGEIGHQTRVDGEVTRRDHQEGVTIGFGFFHALHTDVASTSGHVVHHGRDFVALRQVAREKAREQINGATRGKRRHHMKALRAQSQGVA